MLARFPAKGTVAALTAAALVGCVSWHPIGLAAGVSETRPLPFRVRVTRVDSSRVTVLAPFLRADTLYGRLAGDTIGIPLSAIGHAEREQTHLVLTAAVVLMAPIVFVATLYFISCGSSGHRCADSVS